MPKISASQNIFLNGLNTKFRAFVGGFGSGKTFVGCLDLLKFFGENPGTVQGYFSVSYPSIRDVFYPTFAEAAEMMGFTVVIKTGDKEVNVFRNGKYYGTVICRSMDNPGSIIGYKISRALVDEIDTLTKEKAQLAWRKIIARLRLKINGVENSIGVTTTPEGFLFVYDQFKREPTQSYSMVQSSTYENMEHLPDDYIPSLIETYPENLIHAYINGDFVNLKSGTVYNNYDRKLNYTARKWDGKEPVYIGMDFNVGQMAAVVHVKDDGQPRAVDEIMKGFDTPQMIKIIQERYQKCSVRIYPDASGGSRKSVDASKTDLALLTQAGFSVISNKKNPFVKDRVLSMNVAFCNSKNERSYLVNSDMCPEYADCLEQQIWGPNGEPDKSAGVDHANDAGGYFICFDYSVEKPAILTNVRFAH